MHLRLYGRFTMETILATAFGRTVNVQRGESDQIVEAAYYIFRLSEEGSSFSIAILLPLISKTVKTVSLATDSSFSVARLYSCNHVIIIITSIN